MQPSQQQLEFFLDRALGRHLVPGALRDAGLTVRTMVEEFGEREQSVSDVEWLNHAGQQGWVVLTKDRRIRRRPAERQVILDSGVRAFVLSRGDLTGQQQAERFVATWTPSRQPVPRLAPSSTSSTSAGFDGSCDTDDRGRLAIQETASPAMGARNSRLTASGTQLRPADIDRRA